MKRLFNYMVLALVVATAGSCSKVDNYPGPDQTVQGRVYDAATGQTIQGEVSGENGSGTRIKLLETSWSSNPTPEYLETKQDGTYINTKVFAATYKMTAEGAFVPMVQTNSSGQTTVDQSQTVEVKGGTTTVDFKVEPLLRIDWVGTPVLNANGTITAQVKVTRGTANASFQNNITDLWLFISPSGYVGNNNYDNRYAYHLAYSGTTGNAIVGNTLTLTTIGGQLPTKDWYIRVGARTDYGLKIYNYTDVKMLTVK